MRFLPVSETDRAEMLRAIGVSSVQALFAAIPREARQEPDLSAPLSEIEIRRLIGGLSARTANARDSAFSLGAEDSEIIRKAPHTTPVRRVDEVTAAKNLFLRQRPDSRT